MAGRAIAFTGLAALVTPSGRLSEVLESSLREKLFEDGPPDGPCSLCVAPPDRDGLLAFPEIQRMFFDEAMRAAAVNGILNLVPRFGDGDALPFEDATLDAALLVSILGEIPDQTAALRELHRALRPGGTLVVRDTTAGDAGGVTLRRLRERAWETGFQFERTLASPLGQFPRFARA